MSSSETKDDAESKPLFHFEVCTPAQVLEMDRLMKEIIRLSEVFGGMGTEHPKTLEIMLEYSELCFATRKLEEAERWFKRAWEGSGRALNRPFQLPHIQVFRTQSRLAKTLSDLRRFYESESHFREALAGLEAHLGVDSSGLISTVDGLAIVLHELNKLEESEQMYRRLRQLQELSVGAMHPDTLNVLNRLAMVLRDANKLPEADRICVESLENCTVVLGKDHPTTQASVEIAAYVRHAMGLSEEAEDMFRLALACNERKLGYNHPATVSIVSRIGTLLSDQQDWEQSEVYHRRALEACILNYGREHPKTLDEAHLLGVLVLRREDIVEAEMLLRWAYTGRDALFPGVLHPDTMDSAHHLALLVQRQAQWRYHPLCGARLEETERLLRMALRGRDEAPSIGPEHDNSIETAMRLAVFLFDEHRTIEAEDLWRRVYKSRRRVKGDLSKETAEAAYNLGIILQQRKKFVEASEVMHVCVKGYEAVYGRQGERPEWVLEDEERLHPVLDDALKVLANCESMALK